MSHSLDGDLEFSIRFNRNIGLGGEEIESSPVDPLMGSPSQRSGTVGSAGPSLDSEQPSSGRSPGPFSVSSNGTGELGGEVPPIARLNLQVVVVQWFEQALPFLFLLLCLFLEQHLLEILIFGMLLFMAVRATHAIRLAVALRNQDHTLSRPKLLLVSFGLAIASLLSMLVIFNDDFNDFAPKNRGGSKLWQALVLIPPQEEVVSSFWNTVFRCAMADVLSRHMGTILKSLYLFVCVPSPGKVFRMQGHILTFIEHATILYATILPIPIWYQYFQTSPFPGDSPANVGQKILSSTATGFYLTLKLSATLEKVWLFFGSCRALLASARGIDVVGNYGQRATAEDVAEHGDAMCSICQGDEMVQPIKLHNCKHIFCEDCIAEWLERDNTCPLCRAVVKPRAVKSYSDGSTAWLIQIF